ncbi:MAG: hypothetical protein GY711_12105 [bacterium]|nr:hypothetical protein [bacterium]
MMGRSTARRVGLVLVALALPGSALATQSEAAVGADGPIAHFRLDGDTRNASDSRVEATPGGALEFVAGLDGVACRLRSEPSASTFSLAGDDMPGASSRSFSVQFWLRTTAADGARMLVLSNKRFEDNSFASQRQAGWAFLISHGTWAWNLGSGGRRISYERDNGEHMPMGDGRWHQLTMTYDSSLSVVHLFYDGENKAIYNVRDSTGFDFTSARPILVGGPEGLPALLPDILPDILPAIGRGAQTVQDLVDAFHALGVGKVAAEELVELIVEPKRLYERKLAALREKARQGGDVAPAADAAQLARIKELESELMANPYTVHQAFTFMEVAPLLKLYSLFDGRVVIDEAAARAYSSRERLDPSEFDIDELTLWDRPLSVSEVRRSYAEHFLPAREETEEVLPSITVGVWNIFHGGLHFSVEDHGWDSRLAIAQIIEKEALDVVLLQETYSAGDFLAAELGYCLATTVDWDYLGQGSNISVLSRFPIVELRVPEKAPFMNVAARIALSETQDAWVMSNWYGMDRFPDVSEFHSVRFAASDTTPIFFGGDFNAIPASDGGESLAATTLLDLGFTDAFRSLHPDASEHPGHTHRSGRRIDQLFYKGAGLENTSTRILREWPIGFPSDHYLIRAAFELSAVK